MPVSRHQQRPQGTVMCAYSVMQKYPSARCGPMGGVGGSGEDLTGLRQFRSPLTENLVTYETWGVGERSVMAPGLLRMRWVTFKTPTLRFRI